MSGGEWFFYMFIVIMCFAGIYLLVFYLNGCQTQEQVKEKETKRKQDLLNSRKAQGPDKSENYVETLRLYRNAHPMICEILDRDKSEILKMVFDPKHINIKMTRDMYRLSSIFNFNMPELMPSIPRRLEKGSSLYDYWKNESDNKIEKWKKNLGISDVYDDPFAVTDPYKPWSEFVKGGISIAKKYGYFENGKPNIFRSNEEWWERRKK